MVALQIYKRKYNFSNPEKYQLFLKEHILKLAPRFYSVVNVKEIETVQGTMFAIKIIYNEIQNPKFEPIAEAIINSEYIYLWRDYCWAIAVDKNDKHILKEEVPLIQHRSHMTNHGLQTVTTFGANHNINDPIAPCNKRMIIHQIGIAAIE